MRIRPLFANPVTYNTCHHHLRAGLRKAEKENEQNKNYFIGKAEPAYPAQGNKKEIQDLNEHRYIFISLINNK